MLILKPEPLFTSELGILASLFAGPISWVGYTILLIPVLYGKTMNAATRIGCVLRCIPLWFLPIQTLISRAVYILFWTPSFYPLALIAFDAVRAGRYDEESSADLMKSPITSEVSCCG